MSEFETNMPEQVWKKRYQELEAENLRLRTEAERSESERERLEEVKGELETRHDALLNLFCRLREIVDGGRADTGTGDSDDEFFEIGRELDRILDRIEEFRRSVVVIKRISAQLELLGVNATIQAAHAGEKGKGFLIVADEINKLSAHSKRSVEEALRELKLFSEITHGLSKDFNRTAESIEGNLTAFRELDALFDAHAPEGIKEQCETKNRL